jgi:CRP/FNR family transcriptional regulator
VSGFADADSASTAFISARTYRTGELVFKAGDKFDGIFVVRSGFFKSSFIDASGEMQVTGFHFPGDVIGIDGIGGSKYGDTVAALDTGSLCKIPFSVFVDSRNGKDPKAQDRMLSLVRMMSSTISRDRNMIFNLGKMDARRRFATFLLDIANRMGGSGYNSDDFSLCMSRTDISNYLCLAIETVSRLFSQFHSQGIIHVERRQVNILQRDILEGLAMENQAGETRLSKAG